MSNNDISPSLKGRDSIAQVVIDRLRRAIEYRQSYIVHQGMSFQSMIEQADAQFRREYTAFDKAHLTEAFGFVPSRYYGVAQQKILATYAWMNDLVIGNLDNMFTVTPSPEPELDKTSIERIRAGVRDELFKRMQATGIVDANLLLVADGSRPAERVEWFLQEQVQALKEVEQKRIVDLASRTAQKAQRRMRDTMIEGGFRQAYAFYAMDRCTYGLGIMKFPDFQRKPVLKHKGKNQVATEWVVKPWFRHVNVDSFFPIADAVDCTTNTGNTEYTYVTKTELINMANQDEYYTDQIEALLDDFEYAPRNWLLAATGDDPADYWGLDETIPLLIHEGFFSGDELAEYGITGIDSLDYVSAHVEICGGRTIRCSLTRMPGGADRTYFVSPLNRIGENIYDCLGLAAMVRDTEYRVNVFMHFFEDNADWASRPPIITNPSVFENPDEANRIRPGFSYSVEDRYGVTGSIPEPLRSMNTISAQYHLLMTQVGMLLRQADEDCGIPAFAYGAQDYGRSSLGEFSQRMSNALRTVKQAALNEDIYFIEPGFTGLFHYEMKKDKELREGQDVGIVIRGMTGLLKQDAQVNAMQQVTPMVMGDQTGLVPGAVKEYALRRLLEDAGFPVASLGLQDPETNYALAVAANQPVPSLNISGQQVPQLDGRSGVPQANVASPSGASQFSIPNPSLGG